MTQRIDRRTMLALLGSTGLLAACGDEGSGGVLRVGNQRASTKALMVAAKVLDGLPYQIEWSEFPAAQPLLEAIGSGAVDVGLVGDAPFQFAYQAGSPIRVVAAQTVPGSPRQAQAIIVPRGSAIRGLPDLRGRTVATTRGSIGHFLVLRALEANGLPAGAVRFSFLSPGDAKAAFSSGAVDAWSTWAPYLTMAIDDGAREIVDAQGLMRGYAFEVAHVDAIARKRVLLADFLDREAIALRWAVDHVDEYAAVFARETGLPLALARTTVLKLGRVGVPIDAKLIEDQQAVLSTFVRAGAARGTRPMADAFEYGLADA